MPRLVSTAPRVKPEAKISPRALPRSLMAVYYLDEERFREMTHQLESNETFRSLQERGLVERVRFRGKMPQHRYEEYKDTELVEFFRKHAITRHPDWQLDFLSPGAVARRQSIARKYRIPLGPLTSVLRYLSYLSTLDVCSPSYSLNTREEEPDFLAFAASPDVFDPSPHVERIRRFCERSDLSPEEFNSLFLACKPDVDAILARVSAPVQEVESVLAALDKIQILNSLHFDMREAPSTPRSRKGPSRVVAEVVRGDGPLQLELRFLADRVYDIKYRFNSVQPGQKLTARERELVEQLKALNQRKTVLCRIVTCLFRHQYRFMLSGDRLQMVPLTQAQVARELQEEEATVSRLIRDKVLSTPHGDLPLKKLFRKVSEVVLDLIGLREAGLLRAGALQRPFTDRRLQEMLRDEFGVELSRRAITYHRNRTSAGANFYTRRRKARDADGDGR